MSKTLKEALIEGRECPHGAVLLFIDGAYEVEPLPEGAVIVVPPEGTMPVPVTRMAKAAIDELIMQLVHGRLARAIGKKIKRRVTSG